MTALGKVKDFMQKHPNLDEFHEGNIDLTAEEMAKLVNLEYVEEVRRSSKHIYFRLTKQALASEYSRDVKLPENLFDSIVGYDDIKQLIKSSMLSEKPVHFLLSGAPSSAKTMFLLELKELKFSYYMIANNTSNAGLTQVLQEELPYLLLIDEIDKVKSAREMDLLHSLMESGIVAETKFNRSNEMKVNTRVIATCNDPARLSGALKSKFEVLHLPSYTREQFFEITSQILVHREQIAVDISNEIAAFVWDDLKTQDVRQCVRIARLVKAGMSGKMVMSTIVKYNEHQNT